MAIFLLIVGLLMFVGLVVLHEFGHFIMARRNGIDVEEFGIGFPPAFYKRRIHSKKGDYDFTLNLLPLGGFVRMKGESDAAKQRGSFGAASLGAKVKVMVAGVVMNFLAAYVLLVVVALVGMPQLVPNQYSVKSDTHVTKQADTKIILAGVTKGSPADKAGLKKGDQVVAIGPARAVQDLANGASLQNTAANYAGQEVVIRYDRAGQTKDATARLNTEKIVNDSLKTNNPTGYLGVELNETSTGVAMQRSTWSAPIVAGGLMVQFTALTFQGLGHALGGVGSIIAGTVTGNTSARQSGQAIASSQVSGPVGIFEVLKAGSAQGYQLMLFIIAIISLSLAIMNILPIPALDGGRLWFTLGARLIGRPLSQRAEELINSIGFVVLIGLIILITIVDVRR